MQRQGSVAQLSSSTSAMRKRAARLRSGKSASSLIACALALIVHLCFCAPSLAQCVTTTEAFDDPRLASPTFLRVGDPDGDGPLPEQFLVTQDGLVDKTQIFDGANRTTILNTSLAPIEAVMFQGQWHILRNATPRLSRWDGSALVAIPQIPGSVLSFTEHQGELYFVTALTNGTFQGQIIRWNGVRAEVVGRYTAPSTGLTVRAMASHGTSLYIAANFTAVEGVTINRVACFTPSGATGTWTSPTFATSLGTATIQSIASYNDSLYMCTNLGTAGSNFWKLNAASNAWQLERDATTPTRGPTNPRRLMATGGFLYAFGGSEGGYRITGTSTTGLGFYRWNGTHWLDMTGLANEWGYLSVLWDGNGFPLAVPYQGQFAFVARIGNFNGSEDLALASWNGTRFSLLAKGPTGYISEALPYAEGVVVVGRFGHAGGVPAQGVARWDGETFHPMGQALRAISPGNNAVYSVHLMNGELFVGGTFTWVNLPDPGVSRLARWDGNNWVQGYPRYRNQLPSPIFCISSFDSNLVVASADSTVELTNTTPLAPTRPWQTGLLNHEGRFYFVDTSSSGTRLGVRNPDGTTQWLAQTGSYGRTYELLPFQDEIWMFGGPYQQTSTSSLSSVGRVMPTSNTVVPALGALQTVANYVLPQPAVYQGDVWWGSMFDAPGDPSLLRWNGIEWKRPILRANGQDIFIEHRLGRAVLRMPRADGTEELWLNFGNLESSAFPETLTLRYRASPPPLLTLQPTPSTACLGDTATFTFATQSNEGVTHAWRFNNLVLTDGPVAGLGVVSGARTTQLTITNLQTTTGSIDALATTDCGTSYTIKVPVAPGNTCCDTIDFNNDQLFPTDEDVIDFFSVLAGGACSNAPNCNDIDFNNDGLFPSDDDLIAFLRVLAGGSC